MGKDSPEDQLTATVIQIVKEKKPQTVKQLATLVQERLQIPEEQILAAVIKLQSEGKLELQKQYEPAPPRIAAYLKTENASWFWTTATAAIATVAAVLAIPEEAYPWAYIRNVLGTIFVLWLPGYSFIKALYPAKPPGKEKELDTVERAALSIGMSLALVPMAGLILNYTPWGIRLTPIVISLLFMTLAFAAVGLIREHQARKNSEPTENPRA